MTHISPPTSRPPLKWSETYCTSPCANRFCERRLTDAVLLASPGVVATVDLRCPLFRPDPAPAGLIRRAVNAAMEEAEMFGDLTRSECAAAMAWLNTLPTPVLAAIGRAYAKALKEVR